MQFNRFIAARIMSGGKSERFSRPIVRIAVGGIALGMTIMILSICIMNGFQGEIREKAVGFGAHIQVVSFSTNNSLEAYPITVRKSLADSLKKFPGVKHVQMFGVKAGIIKSGDELQGVVLKGVGKDFDWSFFKNALKAGKLFSVSDTGTGNEVLVSKPIADKLHLEVGKKFRMYFMQENSQRVRVFKVCGIYETGLETFDELYVLGDMRHVQQLNLWEENAAAGFEVQVNDYREMNELTEQIRLSLPTELNALNVRETNPQIFSWLEVIDMNVIIIISLLLFVGIINMISALIILILERTNMIGILKTLGSSNTALANIFLRNAVSLIGKGLLLGNILGFGIAILQLQTGWLKLDQASYYVSTVPIRFDWFELIGVNVLCLVICTVALILPAFIVSRISPVKAIRFS
jgi:lipoprotein-releasing system permease protein